MSHQKSGERIDPSQLEEVFLPEKEETSNGKFLSFLKTYKVFLVGLILVGGLIGLSLRLRSSLLERFLPAQSSNTFQVLSNASPSPNSLSSTNLSSSSSTIETPAPSDNSNNSVLGASSDNTTYTPPVPASTPAPTGPDASLTNSSLSANSVPADGSSLATVNVTIKNSSGTPMGGVNVSLSASDGSVNFSPPSLVTNSSGMASFKATSYSSTDEIINANVSSGNGSTILNDLGDITFKSLGSSTSSSSTSSNCSTGPGVANSWYTDFYPSSPINVTTSATITVTIRDCSVNTAPVSDTIQISQTSGNNVSYPSTINAQNGQASFTVTSQTSVSTTFTITDTTNNFNITDVNNRSLNINFSGASSPAPSPSPSPSSSDSPSPTPSPIPSPS